MKKALKIIGIIVVVIFLLLLILPFVFKGKIIELVKQEANKNLKAKVEFTDVDLSLIRNFPNLAVDIHDLSIAGVERFEGDTLVRMENFALVLDIMSVIKGDQVVIKKIALESPRIAVKVLEDGAANYDIAIESEEAPVEEEPTGEGEAMKLDLQKYSISDGVIIYDDATLPMRLVLDGLDHSGNGDFSQDIFTLRTESHVANLFVEYDGITYVEDIPVDLVADLGMNFEKMRFEFMENRLDVNKLSLAFDGFLEMPADDIVMDITYSADNTSLASIMSLIPATFAKEMDGVNAAGTVAFNGYVKGTYNEENLPGFMARLDVANGSVQYPDLPKSIQNIRIDAKVESPGGSDLDKLTVDVPAFHMEIGRTSGEPNTVDAFLYLRNPMSDPNIRTQVDADLNLGSFKDVVPLEEGFELAGNLSAHFKLNGNLSAIENQRFNEFEASGGASLEQFKYKDADVNAEVPLAQVDFTPQKLNVKTLQVIYEDINMQMDGYVDNYVAYALQDTTLHGVFNFSADKIDLNKFMTTSDTSATEEEEAQAADTASSGVVPIPDNLDLLLTASIGEVLYDDLILKNINGKVTLKNEIASLENLAAQALGGSITLNGSYNTQNIDRPTIDFAYDIDKVAIDQTFKAFNTVQKIAPIAEHASGLISSTLNITADLDQNMEPVYETMNGRGTLTSDQVILEGGPFLQKLSNTLKSPKLAKQRISDLNATFIIENGKVETAPFDVKIDAITATISGWVSFEEKIDYLMEMKVPAKELGSEFNQFAQGMLSQANALLGSGLSMGEYINIDVSIEGNLYDPDIKPSFAGMGGESLKDKATDAVKEVVKEKVEEVKDKAREELEKKAQEALAEAQKQADKIVSEAEKAAAKIREEADKQAQKLLDEASNPLAKAGARVAAKELKDQADKRANDVVKEAQKQADKIMDNARKEADKIRNGN